MKLKASKSKIFYPTKDEFKKLAVAAGVAVFVSGCGVSTKKPNIDNSKDRVSEKNVSVEDSFPEVTAGLPPIEPPPAKGKD